MTIPPGHLSVFSLIGMIGRGQRSYGLSINLQTVDFHETGKTIREVAREQTDLSEEEFDEALDACKMTEV